MNIILIGAELEENLGLNYMASALEKRSHDVKVIAFNSESDLAEAVRQVKNFEADIVGLSMVFTGRAEEFCRLARELRDNGYKGHLIAGGHFASFNCQQLLEDFPAFDTIGLGEGEELMCTLADNLNQIPSIPGICYRETKGNKKGNTVINKSLPNRDQLDTLPFPKRAGFHEYFGKPIASILSSRGCWRNCAFCSINAWYKRVGGKKFRFRSIDNIAAEMKELYFKYGVRIFNFQDDNFFLPNPQEAAERFEELVARIHHEGMEEIAIAVKARPDSITYESISQLDKLGLFRVFLGVENASETGLEHLNRKCSTESILNALKILNDFNIHVAFNLLMFEPDTTMEDILVNLHFIERHTDNPFNFCRAEAYEGTGLAYKLRKEKRLLGDYFGFDYRLTDPYSEAFHEIANYAFFHRNFSDEGLHYFNMQVDFCYQILRRFYPHVLNQSLRGAVKNFIKHTDLDTYQYLCNIYDFVETVNPNDHLAIMSFARRLRNQVDNSSNRLRIDGERILDWMDTAFHNPDNKARIDIPYNPKKPYFQKVERDSPNRLSGIDISRNMVKMKEADKIDLFGIMPEAIPYKEFKSRLAKYK